MYPAQIALVATAIFRVVDSTTDSDPGNVYYGKHGVSWVLRFGGVSALVGNLPNQFFQCNSHFTDWCCILTCCRTDSY